MSLEEFYKWREKEREVLFMLFLSNEIINYVSLKWRGRLEEGMVVSLIRGSQFILILKDKSVKKAEGNEFKGFVFCITHTHTYTHSRVGLHMIIPTSEMSIMPQTLVIPKVINPNQIGNSLQFEAGKL